MYNYKNYAIMKKAIKLLSLVDKYDFIDVFIVISIPTLGVRAIESIAFLTEKEAQDFCDWKNREENTCKYRVYKTAAHV